MAGLCRNGIAGAKFTSSLVARILLAHLVLSTTMAAGAQDSTPASSSSKGATKSATAAASVPAPASTTKLRGQINAFGMYCVSSGVTPLSTQLPTTVEEVKPGTPAFYAGVVAGDRILQAFIEKDKFSLKIERNGRIYLATMQPKMDSIRPKTG